MKTFRYPFGVAYYPEHWPGHRWEEDARQMRETGLNIVRLGEFAWSRLEPSEGTYSLDWLAQAVNVLAREGLDVILCTPTASPPAWVAKEYPEVLSVDREGRRAHFGSRRHYCPNNTVYRRLCKAIATVLAQRLCSVREVVGWQVDNELSGDCFCPVCEERFQSWLRGRYTNIERLNAAWGTVFWGQEYGAWDDIVLPHSPPSWSAHNPGLLMDYYRFMSESWIDFYNLQAEVLRRESPGRWVTTNLLAFPLAGFDYSDLAKHVDFVGWDSYDMDPAVTAMGHDLMRGLKGSGFWVLEEQLRRLGPRPLGWNRLMSYQALARGADGMVHFRWRHTPWGTEQMLPLLFDGDGRPRREYAELKQTAGELARFGTDIPGTKVPSEVAMLVSTEVLWASWIQEWIHDRSYYLDLLRDAYRPLWDMNVPVDLVFPDADLSSYRLVLAPYFHVAEQETAKSFETFVKRGGCLVLTAGSGQKNRANAFHESVPPGPLQPLVGALVRDSCYQGDFPHEARIKMTSDPFDGIASPTQIYYEILEPVTAETIGVYSGGSLDGQPAATRHRLGQGQVLYVGTFPTRDFFHGLLGRLITQLGMEPMLRGPEGVEACRRIRGDQEYLFLLNHSEEEREVDLPGSFRDCLGGNEDKEKVRLRAFGVFVGLRDLEFLRGSKNSV